MDQDSARSLAREAGARAKKLGVNVTRQEDPDCAELVDGCVRAAVELAQVVG